MARNVEMPMKLNNPTALTMYGTVTQPAGIPVAIISKIVVLILELF